MSYDTDSAAYHARDELSPCCRLDLRDLAPAGRLGGGARAAGGTGVVQELESRRANSNAGAKGKEPGWLFYSGGRSGRRGWGRCGLPVRASSFPGGAELESVGASSTS